MPDTFAGVVEVCAECAYAPCRGATGGGRGPRGVERCVPGAHAKIQLKGLNEWKTGFNPLHLSLQEGRGKGPEMIRI